MPRFLLLAAALGIVTSCVPHDRAAMVRHPAAPRPPEGRALLQALALEVPDAAGPLAPRAVQPLDGDGAPPPFLPATQSEDDAARALDCLTQAVYYEARSETLDGQRAVAQVVLNRVRDRAFPHSVCGVVFQHPAHAGGCQFSFTCDGSMNARREPGAWDRARLVAGAALSGSVFAPVGSAVFYHTHAVSPWWAPSLSRIGSIGAHIFYRWHDALARSLSFRQDYAGIEPIARTAPILTAATIETGVTVARGSLEGGVAVHRVGAAAPTTARLVEAAGVRIHLGSAAGDGEAAVAPPTDDRT